MNSSEEQIRTAADIAREEGWWFRHNQSGEWLSPDDFTQRVLADPHKTASAMLHWTTFDPVEYCYALHRKRCEVDAEFFALRAKLAQEGVLVDDL